MVKNAFTEVFKNKLYVFLAGAVMFIAFTFAVWLPNIGLLFSLTRDPMVSTTVKLTFPLRLLESISTNFTTLSATYTIVIALLTGINVALMAYYVRRQKLTPRSGILGVFGIGSGVFGMGCAACGSIILTSILGTVGGMGAIAALPLRGGEFGIVGVVLLLISTYTLSKSITKPAVCKI